MTPSKKELQQLRWIYYDAKYRCQNPNHKRYKNYGGRGILFKFSSFKEWYNHIGPRLPNQEMDRINNDGHYEIGNLRWTDFSTQQLNKRVYKNNTSGVKGVNYVSSINKWVARCNTTKDGKRKYLYVGQDYKKACDARQQWEHNYCSI